MLSIHRGVAFVFVSVLDACNSIALPASIKLACCQQAHTPNLASAVEVKCSIATDAVNRLESDQAPSSAEPFEP